MRHLSEAVPGAETQELNLKSINEMERAYLELLQYSMHVTASLFAKYYFELRSLAGSDQGLPPVLTKDEGNALETRSAYQESAIKADPTLQRSFTMLSTRNKKKGIAIIS